MHLFKTYKSFSQREQIKTKVWRSISLVSTALTVMVSVLYINSQSLHEEKDGIVALKIAEAEAATQRSLFYMERARDSIAALREENDALMEVNGMLTGMNVTMAGYYSGDALASVNAFTNRIKTFRQNLGEYGEEAANQLYEQWADSPFCRDDNGEVKESCTYEAWEDVRYGIGGPDDGDSEIPSYLHPDYDGSGPPAP